MVSATGKFAADLAAGEAAEARLADLFKDAGLKVRPRQGADLSSHDLEVYLGRRWLLVEVKHDRMEAATGNLAIEFYNPRRAACSGILASRADLWAFMLASGPHVCSADRLLQYFIINRADRAVAVAGDGNASIALYRTSRLTSSGLLQPLTGDIRQVLKKALAWTEK